MHFLKRNVIKSLEQKFWILDINTEPKKNKNWLKYLETRTLKLLDSQTKQTIYV